MRKPLHRLTFWAIAALLAAPWAAAREPLPQGPRALAKPVRLEAHGDVRIDNYFWLRERENPAVREYLRAENNYFEAILSRTGDLRERLYLEIKSRVPENDISAPYRKGDYLYMVRTVEGQQYPIYLRQRLGDEASLQEILNVNQLAQGHDYCAVEPPRVSYGQNLLAFAVDTVGRRFHEIRFRDLSTGAELLDTIPNVTSDLAWANDNRTLFYTQQDPETLRPYRVYRHVLGTDPTADVLVYEEADETFSVRLAESASKQYLMIVSQQTLSTEVRWLDAYQPLGDWKVFAARQKNHEYSVDHYGNWFYVRSNQNAPNFRLLKTPVAAPERDNWQEVVAHRADVLLETFALFRDHLVLQERRDGLLRLRVRPWSGQDDHEIAFDEPAYTVALGTNPERDTVMLRFSYSSLTTPPSDYDYNMVTREKVLRKRQSVLGDFDPANYRTLRLQASARDGTRIPVSLVYRADQRRRGANPLLLTAYGSYGYSTDAEFTASILSLLDRGFVFAIAHVRGGQELGRQWYENGKLLQKKNTFFDFIDAAEFLIREGCSDPHHIYAVGASAGGLTVGAAMNLRPDLFRGVIADVPFVDVVTTMLDDTIPLTTSEYDEWGNPHDKLYYDYIRSYSPYDNVQARSYPHVLITAGWHDSQVQYWEPAKWAAKLRATRTDDHLVLLQTKMEAGHAGPSGRYRLYRETANWWAFLIYVDQLTQAERP